VFDLGQRLGGRLAGLTAAIFYNATLTVGVGSILAIPDVPASLFWVLTLWAMARARDQAAWWLCAGLAAGLACLSKYSALFLAPGVLLWLALTAQGRRQLARPWPWLAALIALALFSLNVGWPRAICWNSWPASFCCSTPRSPCWRGPGRYRPGGAGPSTACP
jgi:4-amino-4-deoxy-L-arabinose transferase-like glycosyltransferase